MHTLAECSMIVIIGIMAVMIAAKNLRIKKLTEERDLAESKKDNLVELLFNKYIKQ